MNPTLDDLLSAAEPGAYRDSYAPSLETLLLEVEDDETLESFAATEAERLSVQADSDPTATLMHLTTVTTAMAQAAQQVQGQAKQPRIIKLLTSWVSKLKSVVQKLKASLGFTSFSISVTIGPVSIGLTW